jgi:hypothetical protein
VAGASAIEAFFVLLTEITRYAEGLVLHSALLKALVYIHHHFRCHSETAY